MTSITAEVTWKGKVFKVDVETTSDVKKLKNSLYQLSGVPEDKQKIMAKSKGLWKGILKDKEDLSKFKWEEGMKLTMIGNSEGVPKKQKGDVVFIEDMSSKEQQKFGKQLPPGLENLGNTCYMNSTLQCLKAIPELRKSLETVSNDDPMAGSSGKKMTVALGRLFRDMDNGKDYVVPSPYVNAMRRQFPQFAQQGPKGMGFSQQDADEYFNALVSEMAAHLTRPVEDVEFGHASNAIDALFGIETTIEMKCNESADEPIVYQQETLRRLQCKITDTVSTLEEGLKVGFEGDLEKRSDVLGRNAVWKTTQKLHRVPLYLAIQFNRFFWKRTPNSRDHEGINCKIRKRVKFPLELDIHQFCDDELRDIMKPARDLHTEKLIAMAAEGAAPMEEDPEVEEAKMLSLNEGRTAGPGVSPNFRGIYELFGVVTHIGRASDSGHYMGWVKQGPDSWICFNDDEASECKDEDIVKLAGDTADWHIAYMAYYRVKID